MRKIHACIRCCWACHTLSWGVVVVCTNTFNLCALDSSLMATHLALCQKMEDRLPAFMCQGRLRCSLPMRSVWYMDRHQQRQPATVVAVDVMHPPPSYCIRLEGADSTRDTEEARLEPRAAQLLPKPAKSAPEAQSAAAKPEGRIWSSRCLHVQYSPPCACIVVMMQRCGGPVYCTYHVLNHQLLTSSYSCRRRCGSGCASRADLAGSWA